MFTALIIIKKLYVCIYNVCVCPRCIELGFVGLLSPNDCADQPPLRDSSDCSIIRLLAYRVHSQFT